MNIALLSDLHVEFHGNIPDISPEADAIVLAGDIDTAGRSGEVVEKYRARYGKPVILVAGNHDLYQTDLVVAYDKLRDEYDGSQGIWFLENDEALIDGVRFLGCTLWSDFELLGPTHSAFAKAGASQIISDFTQIDLGPEFLTVSDVIEMHQVSMTWLESALMAPPADVRATVVVTHFGPHEAAVHPRHRASAMTPYYVSDCSRLMHRYGIDAWFYGHTHDSIDQMVEGGTRLVSNQRGYVGESAGFDSMKLVEIP